MIANFFYQLIQKIQPARSDSRRARTVNRVFRPRVSTPHWCITQTLDPSSSEKRFNWTRARNRG